jgi:ketosteroid isomerase-like protein
VSEENVAAVQAFIDAYNRRDFVAAVEAFDPSVEWILPERQSSDSCRGPGAVIRFWKGIDDTFDDLQLRPQEHHDAGDRVATRLRHYGRAKSGVEIDTELYHQVVTFRDGMMVRIEYFASWSEALEAAGLAGGRQPSFRP